VADASYLLPLRTRTQLRPRKAVSSSLRSAAPTVDRFAADVSLPAVTTGSTLFFGGAHWLLSVGTAAVTVARFWVRAWVISKPSSSRTKVRATAHAQTASSAFSSAPMCWPLPATCWQHLYTHVDWKLRTKNAQRHRQLLVTVEPG
jgi:hypothetical protein